MSEYTQITTHVADGTARLLSRWRETPRMVAFTRIILDRVQHLEDVLWAVYTGVWLDNAVGAQLDNAGAIVGELRKGRSDELYKPYIRARVAINRANGKLSDTLKVARLILESTATVTYAPEYPAAYRVTVENTALPASDLSILLRQVKPPGVQLTTVVVPATATAFIFNTSTPLVNGFNHGLMADGI